MLRETVRSFAEEKIAPFAEEWDRKSYFSYKEAVKPMGELGCAFTILRYGTEAAKKKVHREAGQRQLHGLLRHHEAPGGLGHHGDEVHGRGQG
jgi:hypothetical protein